MLQSHRQTAVVFFGFCVESVLFDVVSVERRDGVDMILISAEHAFESRLTGCLIAALQSVAVHAVAHFGFDAVDGDFFEFNVCVVEHRESFPESARKAAYVRQNLFHFLRKNVFFVLGEFFEHIAVVRKFRLFRKRQKLLFRAQADFRFHKA